MNKYGKATLMAGASALALGLAMSQASAFQDVDWEWDLDFKEKIKIKIDPSFKKLDPRGLVQVETLQISIGDIEAESTVSYIKNDPERQYGDPIKVDVMGASVDIPALYVEGDAKGKIEVKGYAKDSCWWGRKCDYDPVKAKGYADLDVKGHTKPKYNVPVDGGYVYIPVIVETPWAQLPQVVSAATAIANLATVEGNSAVFVHDGQFAIGDVKALPHVYSTEDNAEASKATGGSDWRWDKEDNEHVDIATVGIIGILAGVVESGDVEAESTVEHILNASVDSSATAIANLHSIDVNAEYATDVMVVADIVQFSYMDVEATSDVNHVKVIGYGGLDFASPGLGDDGLPLPEILVPGLDGPLVNSVATAIGNISTINVSVSHVGEIPGGGGSCVIDCDVPGS